MRKKKTVSNILVAFKIHLPRHPTQLDSNLKPKLYCIIFEINLNSYCNHTFPSDCVPKQAIIVIKVHSRAPIRVPSRVTTQSVRCCHVVFYLLFHFSCHGITSLLLPSDSQCYVLLRHPPPPLPLLVLWSYLTYVVSRIRCDPSGYHCQAMLVHHG